jgi:hexokinase
MGVLRYICSLLAERAALLVAVPMATFLDRMDMYEYL